MSLDPTPYEALMQAVEIAGSQTAFAAICEVSQAAVWKWLQSSKKLPAERVLLVEAATGVSRHHLRPDLYPVDLAPGPRWHGVDQRVDRYQAAVLFNQRSGAKRGAAA